MGYCFQFPEAAAPTVATSGSKPLTAASAHPVPISHRLMLSLMGRHIAKDTRIFARQLCLKSCFTRVQSPQSSGISEAFVNAPKRSYVQVTSLPDAQTVA